MIEYEERVCQRCWALSVLIYGWNIASWLQVRILLGGKNGEKDFITSKIWMAKRWEYIHREYEYLNSSFFYYSGDKGVRTGLKLCMHLSS